MSDQKEKEDPKPPLPENDDAQNPSQSQEEDTPHKNEDETNPGGGLSPSNSKSTPPRILSTSVTCPASTSGTSKKWRRTNTNAKNSDFIVPTSRQFAPLIHHRRAVRAYQSAEETMLRSKNPVNLPKQKSISSDTLPRSSDDSEGNNNNGTFKSKNYFFKELIPTPIIQEVIQVSPALCLTESEHNQNQAGGSSGHLSCSKRSSKAGETCINISGTHGSTDSLENICRICHDSPSSEKLIKPCLCKGSMGSVHRSCLEHWLGESGKGSCEICGQEFNTVRVPKYKGIRSLIAWIRQPMNPTDSRNFFFDLCCFFILTPLAFLSGWLCIVGAQTYSSEQQQKSLFLQASHHHHLRGRETLTMRANRDISNSTWTSIGLLSLTGTLVAAYIIWIFVAFRYHLQVWREWQQRNYIVTIVPLENGEFCFPPTPPPLPEEQGNVIIPLEQGELEQRVGLGLNLNNNAVENNGRGRRGRNGGSNENIHSGEGSPTTRFIQQLFIPSMSNWEASNNVNNVNVNATDVASRTSTATLNSVAAAIATDIPETCGVNMTEELQLQLLLEEHHRLVRDNGMAKDNQEDVE